MCAPVSAARIYSWMVAGGRGGGIFCPLALVALALLWLLTFGWGLKSNMVVKAWEAFKGSGEALCCGCCPRCLGVGSVTQVPPAATECKRTAPFRTHEDMHAPLWRLFLSFPPLNALSGDRGVPGSALLAVMDGPWCSTVATVIGYCW